jgi:hypothetical protein
MKTLEDQLGGTAGVGSVITTSMMRKAIGVSVGIALCANILHFVYCAFAPLFYIRFGFFAGVILALVFAGILAAWGLYWGFALPAFVLLFGLILYCCLRKFMKVSAALLGQACAIIRKYPSILLVSLLHMGITLAIAVLFAVVVFAAEMAGISRGV